MGGMTIMALAEQQPELFAERVLGVAFLATSAARSRAAACPAPSCRGATPSPAGLGLIAGWQPLLVEGARRVGHDLIWMLTRRFSYGDRHIDPAASTSSTR
jgi:pimeloyl-ACP methyl ester carboxylesterase